MTHLYIDGQEVVLPEKFSIELRKENPLFTKGGSFTLDINISLYPPQNAKLYKNINRFNSTNVFNNRKAVLISDARVLLLGTEIVLDVTDETVSIQLASGNAQLNYLVSNDRKMSSLDLGNVSVPPVTTALDSLTGSYPTWNYVCCPAAVLSNGSNLLVNNLKNNRVIDYTGSKCTLSIGNTGTDYEIRPMPYLNFLVERTITALGFTVGVNSLLSTVYNRLFVVVATMPKKWNEIFGDILAVDFLGSVEKLFNVIMVVRKDNVVDILFSGQYYSTAGTFVPNVVLDSFTRKYLEPDDRPSTHTSSNIKYAFPSDEYYSFHDISPDIINGLPVVEKTSLTDIVNAIGTPASVPYPVKNILFRNTTNGTEYVSDSFTYANATTDEPRMVQLFKRITVPEDAPTIELDLIPAKMHFVECLVSSPGYPNYSGFLQIPFCDDYTGDEVSSITAVERIKGESEDTQSISQLRLAFYNGKKDVLPIGYEGDDTSSFVMPKYPQVSNHYYAGWKNTKNFIIDTTYATLSLHGSNGLLEQIYSQNKTYNVDQEYSVKGYVGKDMPDPMKIWRVKGKEFACKEIRLTVGPDGLKNEFEAVLYSL